MVSGGSEGRLRLDPANYTATPRRPSQETYCEELLGGDRAMARSLADWGRRFFSRERSTSAPSRRSRRKSHRAGNPLAPQYVYRASLEPLEERQLLAVDAEFVFDIDTNPSPVAPLKTSPPVQVGSWLYFAGSYPTSGNEL